ncbi:MAG: hypothetical protein ABDH49_06425 [Candidatus Hydrothermales bacterium]
MQKVPVLKIQKSYGRDGKVLAKLLVEDESLLQKFKDFYLIYKGGERHFQLESFERRGGKSYILSFKNIDSKDRAEALKGGLLYLKVSPETKEQIEELSNFKVYDISLGYLGVVSFVEETKFLKRIYVKSDKNNEEYIIPWVDKYVKEINEKEKIIKVDTKDLVK